MIKSQVLMKNSGLPDEDVEYKHYPVPEEDSFISPVTILQILLISLRKKENRHNY